MSKALCHMTEKEREEAVARRISKAAGGIGTLAAIDYMTKKNVKKQAAVKVNQTKED